MAAAGAGSLALVGAAVFANTSGASTTGETGADEAVTIIRGNNFGYDQAFTFEGSNSDDLFRFGENAFSSGSQAIFESFDGDDRFSFGDHFALRGNVHLFSGDGNNVFEFGTYVAGGSGYVHVEAADGNQSLTTADNAGSGGSMSIVFGNGNHSLTFGSDSCRGGHILVRLGDGDHTVHFDNKAANNNGKIEILTGSGLLDLTFEWGVGYNSNLSQYPDEGIFIDLGESEDADSISFMGEGSDGVRGAVTITNYQPGVDDLIEIRDEASWIGSDDSDDLVFSETTYGLSTITFVGLAGASTDPLDYFI